MKKRILTLVLAIGMAIPASAQYFSDTPEFYTGTAALSLRLFDSFGLGMISPSAATEQDAVSSDYLNHTRFGGNREIFFNTVFLGFHPYPTCTLGMGIDMRWSAFRLDKTRFWLPEDNYTVSVGSTDSRVRKSTLRVMSIDIPLDYVQRIGPAEVSAGVSAELNFPGRTKSAGVRATGIGTNVVTYSLHAALGIYGIGLYVKYRPVPLFEYEKGPQFQSWTVGLILH